MVSQGHAAKKKGSRYELTIAKKLTNLTHVQFQRTAFSGAQSTDINSERSWIGDLFAEEDSGFDLLNYELKSHDNVTLRNIIMCNGEVPKFMEQVITDTNRNGNTLPCLIINLKNFTNMVIIPYNRELYTTLYEHKPKYLFSTIYHYYDKRKEINYEYNMMAVDIETFGTLKKQDLVNYYNTASITYDAFNIDKQPKEHHLDLDEIIQGVEEL